MKLSMSSVAILLLPLLTLASEQKATAYNATDLTLLVSIFADPLPPCAHDCVNNITLAKWLNEAQTQEKQCPEADLAECLCEQTTFFSELQLCATSRCTSGKGDNLDGTHFDALTAINTTSQTCHFPIRDNSHKLLSGTLASFLLSLLAIASRLIFKLRTPSQTFGLDDLFVTLTHALIIPNVAISLGPARSFGRDVWTLPTEVANDLMRWNFIQTLLYLAASFVLKLSFLFFYRRIFPDPRVRRVLHITLWVTGLYGFAFIFAGAMQCEPIQYYWTGWDADDEAGGKCIDKKGMVWSNAVLGIALDFWVLAIPLWCLRGVQMPWRKKFWVALMFVVGGGATIASIIRLSTLPTIYISPPNPTWMILDLLLCSHIEINLGIICACMPALCQIIMRAYNKRRRPDPPLQQIDSEENTPRKSTFGGGSGSKSWWSNISNSSLPKRPHQVKRSSLAVQTEEHPDGLRMHPVEAGHVEGMESVHDKGLVETEEFLMVNLERVGPENV